MPPPRRHAADAPPRQPSLSNAAAAAHARFAETRQNA